MTEFKRVEVAILHHYFENAGDRALTEERLTKLYKVDRDFLNMIPLTLAPMRTANMRLSFASFFKRSWGVWEQNPMPGYGPFSLVLLLALIPSSQFGCRKRVQGHKVCTDGLGASWPLSSQGLSALGSSRLVSEGAGTCSGQGLGRLQRPA